MSIKEMQFTGRMRSANFPMDEEGRTYHVGLKQGEVANLVLMVGHHGRAELLSSLLDRCVSFNSSRGFLTFSGYFEGSWVTIISIGMGVAMADFAVRELRAIVEGPLLLMRLGTCGTPAANVSIGSIIVARQSFAITTNYDAYIKDSELDKFTFSAPLRANEHMNEVLKQQLKTHVPKKYPVIEATDATADTFYGSQGRIDLTFNDDNEKLLSEIIKKHPDTASLQMETFQLYFLAHIGKNIHAAAAAIVVADRQSDAFLSYDELKILEKHAGQACLKALIESARKI